MALLISSGSTQILGVQRGLGRGGRRGGFLGGEAVNPAPPRSRELRVPGGRDAAAPEERRAAAMLPLSHSPGSPAIRARRWHWRCRVFSRLIFMASFPLFETRETRSLQLCGGKRCGIFSCSLVGF